MNKKIDIALLIDILLLSLFGLLYVYSASNISASYKYDDEFYFFKRQLLFLVIGLIVMYFMTKIDLNLIKKYTSVIFGVILGLLILVLIPGIGLVRGGARSWIGIGVFSIQPAEFMKAGLILLLAKYLSNYHEELKKFKNFLIILLLIGVIFGIIILQPDFGTGLVIVISSILLLFVGGVPFKYFILLGVIGLIGMAVLIISEPYRMQRILAFLDPWSDPLGSGFQGIQSLFAISPSGIFGLGFNKSMQKHFFLPEPQNDFIFAIITEELGLFGGLFLILAYLFILIKAILISTRVEDKYKSFLALGLGISIFIQAFINISVVIGILPITGITLPVISYGGSSLVITLMSLGLLLNVSKYQEKRSWI
ncbi:MAG: putative lipid II flippase FtsW [Bacilli bacterium]|nr:putative lipid II flippase FtsW [Bacilli bacterium]